MKRVLGWARKTVYSIQGRRSSGREGGAVIELRAMETLKKIVATYACFCLETMLTSKIISEIIENSSEFSR